MVTLLRKSLLAAVLAITATGPAEAIQCVLMVDAADGRTLVNACDSCRVAKIEVTRPGAGTPVARSYTLAERSKLPLPLKGANKVRVVGDQACAPSSTAAPEAAAKTCLTLAANKQGNPVLLNSCDSCRSAMLEWQMPDNVLIQENATVVARSFAALTQKDDALNVRLTGERECRK
ncbi:MAG: hypothetical protein H7841_12735 [Magnetospirillum sp. WYHS-4]